ncbi:YcxB family protein [Nonomuraea sp. MTCD27]|uniref:YcxB family protein n=1 Tax=Nonomuraea sp. MTCD27 TaxID=1676747 RepID=UPI0035C06F67
MDFTVQYDPTPDEVVRAFEQGAKRQLRFFYRLLPSILVIAGVVCVLTGGRALGVGMFAGAVAFPFVLNWSIRRMSRRQVAYLCVPTTLHLTGDGYECRTEQITTTMRWSFFTEVVTGPEFWLLIVNKQPAAFLPRRAFTPEQQAELEAVLSATGKTGAA